MNHNLQFYTPFLILFVVFALITIGSFIAYKNLRSRSSLGMMIFSTLSMIGVSSFLYYSYRLFNIWAQYGTAHSTLSDASYSKLLAEAKNLTQYTIYSTELTWKNTPT